MFPGVQGAHELSRLWTPWLAVLESRMGYGKCLLPPMASRLIVVCCCRGHDFKHSSSVGLFSLRKKARCARIRGAWRMSPALDTALYRSNPHHLVAGANHANAAASW